MEAGCGVKSIEIGTRQTRLKPGPFMIFMNGLGSIQVFVCFIVIFGSCS